jgi:hypothetical protein
MLATPQGFEFGLTQSRSERHSQGGQKEPPFLFHATGCSHVHMLARRRLNKSVALSRLPEFSALWLGDFVSIDLEFRCDVVSQSDAHRQTAL